MREQRGLHMQLVASDDLPMMSKRMLIIGLADLTPDDLVSLCGGTTTEPTAITFRASIIADSATRKNQ